MRGRGGKVGGLAGWADLEFAPEGVRGRAGMFRVARTKAGVWWMLNGADQPVFLRAVAVVNRTGRGGRGGGAGRYEEEVRRLHGGEEGFARSVAGRLHGWGFNALGPWSERALGGFYRTEVAGFREAGGAVIRGSGVDLPDVFESGWEARCESWAAARVAEVKPGPECVGWFSDDGLGWGGRSRSRPNLLQVCLSLEPSYAAYHAAWEFAQAGTEASLAGLGRRWGLNLVNKEVLRVRTREERGVETAGFLAEGERFEREFARRYFSVTTAALRRHDPGRLVLGCRFGAAPGAGVLGECVYPVVDVVSWQLHEVGFAALAEVCAPVGMPVLVTTVGLTNEQFRAQPERAGTGPTRMERMLKAGRMALVAACGHPAVVGYEWGRWVDGAGDKPPFGAGLVHEDDREAIEHTELMAHVNARAEGLRGREG